MCVSHSFSECTYQTYFEGVSNGPCLPCPDNSESTEAGLGECPCVQGYYRAPDEGAEEACTRELLISFIHIMSVICRGM